MPKDAFVPDRERAATADAEIPIIDFSPFSDASAAVVNVNVVDVAPAMSPKWTPPSMLTCHCTVGAG